MLRNRRANPMTGKKSFTEFAKLNEAPLSDMNIVTGDREFGSNTKDAVNDPELSKVLTKKLKHVSGDIILNIVSHKADMYKTSELSIYPGAQEFYSAAHPSDLPKMFSKKTANEIKHSKDTINVILVDRGPSELNFKLTRWGVVHDVVHALIAMKQPYDIMVELERELTNTVGNFIEDLAERMEVKNVDSYESILKQIWNIVATDNAKEFLKSMDKEKMTILYHSDIILYMMMTMGSSKSETMFRLPEEAIVELMTQWMYTQNISFDVSKVFKPKYAKKLQKELDAHIPNAIETFKSIVDLGKGKIMIAAI